jgi:hypothetical protein
MVVGRIGAVMFGAGGIEAEDSVFLFLLLLSMLLL